MDLLLQILQNMPQGLWNAAYHVFLDMARALAGGGTFADAVKAAEASALELDKIQAVYDTRAQKKFGKEFQP